MTPTAEKVSDREVLLVISCGLIIIILSIIAGVFLTEKQLPNWAENVLISIGTASILKLGDCLAALISLSTGKSVERLGTALGNSTPNEPVPTTTQDAAEGARAVADKAESAASAIEGAAQ